MPIISCGVILSPADGSTGAHSTRSPDASWFASNPSINCASALSIAAAASVVVCTGGMPSITATSPNCKSQSTSATQPGAWVASTTDRLVDTTLLPTPPLVEKLTI